MISMTTAIIGAPALAQTIERRVGYMQSQATTITRDVLVKIDAAAKRNVPVDTGLLRLNIKILLNSDFEGKNVIIKRGINAVSRSQRASRGRVGRAASTNELQSWINNVKGEVRGAVYNDMPYAWKRNKLGGITKPPYFLTGPGSPGRIGKRLYLLKLKRMSLTVGSI